jgi:hypothetical protein
MEADSPPATESESDLAQAATFAGDPAAAGTDSEGPGTDAGAPVGSTPDVASAAGGPAAGDSSAAEGAAQVEGTAAASPDPAYAPAAEPIPESTSFVDDSPRKAATASASTAAERAEALAEQRPELLVAGAFAGGLVLARVIAALGGRR